MANKKAKRKPQPNEEFLVEIIRNSHGYIKILAENKNEARKIAEAMSKQQLQKYYKFRCAFTKTGEITTAKQE